MAIGPDSAFGSYRVEAALGEGGQAAVWRVRHQTLDSLAALKVLRVATDSLEKRLIQEGRVQASMRHPNIVSVLDVVHLDGAVGLLLEYVDGESLEAWMRTPRSFIEGEGLFLGILSAMEAAHAQGIVHRDLKPANVLLARVGGKLLPKVADFGLARLLDEGGIGTRTGMAMGTLSYMAPEQVRDARTADVRADIFSLGCILYALCTGRTPFPAPDLFGYYRAVERGDYVTASVLVPGLPARFDTAIGACLGFEREERIPDVAALREVLSGARSFTFKAPTGLLAGGGSGASSAGTFDSNGDSIALLAATAVPNSQGDVAPPSPPAVPQPVPSAPARSRGWIALVGVVAVVGSLVGLVLTGVFDRAPPDAPPRGGHLPRRRSGAGVGARPRRGACDLDHPAGDRRGAHIAVPDAQLADLRHPDRCEARHGRAFRGDPARRAPSHGCAHRHGTRSR